MMNAFSQRHALALAGLCLLTVYGCGGGGGGTGAGTPGATTTSVPVTVIDDAIQNATVCLDKNINGVCDTGEPTGKTDAAGQVTLQVAPADVGKFPILAVVGTDAVDSAYGPVTTAFTMTAPADQTAVVSPLTTLVQTTVATTGVSSAEAAASVQNQTGISVSLFQDFTKNTTPEGKEAALLARMVVIVTQEQTKVLSSTVGSPAADGSTVTTADLNQLIQNKVLENLPELAVVASSPAVQAAATPAAITAALTAPAAAIVNNPATGLTAASVPILVAIGNQNANPVVVPPAAPVAVGNLDVLNFSNAQNWFVRGLTATVIQNTPDASNNVRFVDRRARSTAGVVATWNSGGEPARQSDLHFTGTAWEYCDLNAENVASVRDAAGNNTFDYCKKLVTGKSNRATFDVSGKTMASVITEARAAGYTNMSIGNNSAGALSTALGTTAFPASSSVLYQTTTSLTHAPAYYPGLGNRVFQSHPTVAAGRTDPNAPAPCALNPQVPAATEAATLEGLIAASPGTPCINNAATINPPTTTVAVSSGTRNEGWGATTLSMGQIGTAPTGGIPSTYYTTNTPLRVSFAAPNVANYYTCQQRATDGSVRNCNLVSSGTYSIATLGDARVMSFADLPVQAAALTFNRVFVERGGKVFFGYQNKPRVTNSARLNLVGANALLDFLTIGAVDPAAPLELSPASYAGVWQFRETAATTDLPAIRVQINNNATSVCFDVDAAGVVSTSFICTAIVTNPVTGAFTLTLPNLTAVGNLNFLTGGTTNVVFTDVAAPTTQTAATGIRR